MPALAGLKRRADFLAAARGHCVGRPTLVLQGRERRDSEDRSDDTVRVGITCSKKVGKAVMRNRAKRRLREIARLVLGEEGSGGWDYVLIGKRGTTALTPFPDLVHDLRSALRHIHRAKGGGAQSGKHHASAP
ncbi:MAG: ribonuclease P protein component [Pseudomonadota bacterium]